MISSDGISAMTWPEYSAYRAQWLAENETPAVTATWTALMPG